MDEDSKIMHLREYIQLFLGCEKKVSRNEKHRIRFLSEKGTIKSRKSKTNSNKKYSEGKSSKNKFSYVRNQERAKTLGEEIGRNLHTIRQEPYGTEEVFSDVSVESYPVDNGIYASVQLKSDKSKKLSKLFTTEEEAEIWIQNNIMTLSKKFTQ
jgi:hypothetical protein